MQETTQSAVESLPEYELARVRFMDRLRPEPLLLVSEWADHYRILPSKGAAEPGPWRTSRTPYLKAIMDALSTGSPYHTVVFAKGAQIGAPLALDTPIPTPSGWTSMSDLKPGDQVFGSDGSLVNVLGVSPVFHGRDCYRVTFSDGESIVTDADHKWTVDVLKSAEGDGGKVTLTTGQMVSTGKLSRRKLHYQQGNRNKYAIPLADHLRLPDVELPMQPYTFGVWLGDGNSASNQVTTHVDDADEMAGYMCAEGHNTIVRNLAWSTENARNLLIEPKAKQNEWQCIRGHLYAITGTYQITKRGKAVETCAECGRQRAMMYKYGTPIDPVINQSASFLTNLTKHGVLNNKHIPTIYLRSSLRQRLDLLSGIMDTDGHVTKHGRCELTLATQQLANDCMELIRSVGYKPTISSRRCTAATIRGRIVKRREIHYRISFMAYQERPVFKLNRKLSGMVPMDGRRTSETFRRRIIDISPVESVPTRCIAVDSKDHLFLAGKGMIATHNTETGSNWLGYCIHHAPAPAMMVQPTLDMVKRVSKQRIQPMIDATPVLMDRIAPSRARDAGNTLFQKDFPGGTLVMTGANSATGLRSMPARYLFLDEVDAYPGDVEGEGDPVDLAIARTSTFKRNRKIFLCSTPTIEGQSRIWKAFEDSDQQYYFVPCPECDEYQTIDWKRIIWQEGLPDTAALACEHCGSLIEERHKGMMLERGQWRATQASADRHTIGFHLSSLYSPPGWYSWADAAREFLSAQGHPTKLQSFINTKLGQCWEDRAGEIVDEGGLMARREIWRAVPDDCVCLTAGVDCQLDRLEVSIIGFTGTEQAKVLHHHKLIGSPAAPEVWRQLDAILKAEYPTDTGRVMSINAACIDSGGLHTKQVYDYVSANTGRRIFAIKGRAGNHPIWPVKLSNKQLRNGSRLQLIGVDTAKDAIYSALAVMSPDLPKYVSFSMNLPGDYFKQLTVERRVTTYNTKGVRVRVWKKPAGARNEAFDCFVYAVAGLEFLKRHDGRLMQIARQMIQEKAKPAETRKPAKRTSSAIL